MPEGPEIHREADAIADALVGHPAREVRFGLERLEEYEQVLQGLQVQAVEARGKAIVTRFEGGLNMYSHNQLYGKWVVRRSGDTPDTNRQLRVEITNDYQSAYLLSASEIYVLDDEELEEQSYLAKLGPDPLRRETDEEDIIDRFEDETFHRRQLATLLLDQEFVSGVGNYLRVEILWHEEVHPREKLGQMDAERRRGLAEATYRLTCRAYENDGVTVDDELVAELKEQGVDRDGFNYYAYGRDGEPCRRCGEALVEERHGGRRVFLCKRCQPAP